MLDVTKQTIAVVEKCRGMALQEARRLNAMLYQQLNGDAAPNHHTARALATVMEEMNELDTAISVLNTAYVEPKR